MNEKLPLLRQAVGILKQQNKTDLANELSTLVEDLLANIEAEETDQIEQGKQDIDAFLETNKTLLQEHEELEHITDRQSDLTTLQDTINTENEDDEEWTQSWSRRERLSPWRKKFRKRTSIATAIGSLTLLATKAYGQKSQILSPWGMINSEKMPSWPMRQRVIQEMDKIIAADKKNPIWYDFDDTELKKDRDINCSWLVYEIIQRRAWFEICSWGVTSAALYQSMLDKWRPSKPLLQSWDSSIQNDWIQPGDTVFRASKKDFKRKKWWRPAKVNGMPIHHSALIQSVSSDGSFTVLESTWSTGVQVKTYTAQRWLENRKDELHVVRVPYDT